jgi:uncharacterized protein (DUF736 family)
MRKRVVGLNSTAAGNKLDQGHLDLGQIATVEVTSENPEFPIEAVFNPKEGAGWRAAEKGEQRIRIIFDEPVSLRRIQLTFHETERDRTQEIAIRWSSSAGGPTMEILRQRWNFSPSGSTTEREDFTVDLRSVSVLELVIQPDVSENGAVASLASWWLT